MLHSYVTEIALHEPDEGHALLQLLWGLLIEQCAHRSVCHELNTVGAVAIQETLSDEAVESLPRTVVDVAEVVEEPHLETDALQEVSDTHCQMRLACLAPSVDKECERARGEFGLEFLLNQLAETDTDCLAEIRVVETSTGEAGLEELFLIQCSDHFLHLLEREFHVDSEERNG